jgi:hypothetical protein
MPAVELRMLEGDRSNNSGLSSPAKTDPQIGAAWFDDWRVAQELEAAT